MTTNPLREKMSQDLHIAGLRERTHDGYLREIRTLARHFRLSHERITEKQLREYFLYLKNEKQFTRRSQRRSPTHPCLGTEPRHQAERLECGS